MPQSSKSFKFFKKITKQVFQILYENWIWWLSLKFDNYPTLFNIINSNIAFKIRNMGNMMLIFGILSIRFRYFVGTNIEIWLHEFNYNQLPRAYGTSINLVIAWNLEDNGPSLSN